MSEGSPTRGTKSRQHEMSTLMAVETKVADAAASHAHA